MFTLESFPEHLRPQIQVCADLLRERANQDIQWGIQSHDHPMWSLILGEEVGEVCKAVLDKEGDERIREELVQVAAVAMSWIERIDRKNGET